MMAIKVPRGRLRAAYARCIGNGGHGLALGVPQEKMTASLAPFFEAGPLQRAPYSRRRQLVEGAAMEAGSCDCRRLDLNKCVNGSGNGLFGNRLTLFREHLKIALDGLFGHGKGVLVILAPRNAAGARPAQ